MKLLKCCTQYASKFGKISSGHRTGKGVHQGCILLLGLFNLHAEYITQNAGLHEAQAGIKTAREISITSAMQMTPALWQKAKRN